MILQGIIRIVPTALVGRKRTFNFGDSVQKFIFTGKPSNIRDPKIKGRMATSLSVQLHCRRKQYTDQLV